MPYDCRRNIICLYNKKDGVNSLGKNIPSSDKSYTWINCKINIKSINK